MVKENLVAVDTGCAYVKLAWFDEAGQLMTESLPALMARGHAPIGLSGAAETYEIEGEQWHLTNGMAENTQFNSYPYSYHNLALTLAALYKGKKSGDILLSTGIPVQDYYTKTGKNKENIDKKTNMFNRHCTLTNGDLGFSSTIYKVCPEAVSAVVDYVCDDKGDENEKMSGPIAVVDIGGRTTDLSIVDENFMADSQKIKTLKLGCLDFYQSVESDIKNNKKIEAEIPTSQLEKAVSERKIQLFKDEEPLDIDDLIQREKEKLINRIQEHVQRVFGDQHIAQTLYVGGGASLFMEALKKMGGRGVTVAQNPQFANVRGYLKIAQFLTD